MYVYVFVNENILHPLQLMYKGVSNAHVMQKWCVCVNVLVY